MGESLHIEGDFFRGLSPLLLLFSANQAEFLMEKLHE